MSDAPAHARRPDGLPVGRPFVSGDPRRGPGNAAKARGGETARTLARSNRRPVIAALVKLIEANATATSAPLVREVRETAALVLRYSDGEPGAGNVPTELDERRADAAPDEMDGTEPPAVDGAETAA